VSEGEDKANTVFCSFLYPGVFPRASN